MGCFASKRSTDPNDLGDYKGVSPTSINPPRLSAAGAATNSYNSPTLTHQEHEPPRTQDPPAEAQKVEDPPNRTISSRSKSGSGLTTDIQPKLNEEVPGKQSSSNHSPQNGVWSGPPDQAPPRRQRTRSRTRDAPDQRPRYETHHRSIQDAPDQVPRRPRSQSDGYDQVPAETQKVEDPPARNRTVTSRSRSDSTTNEHDTQPNPNEEVSGKQGSSDHSPKNSVWSGPPDQAPPRRQRTRSRTRDAPDQRPRYETHHRGIQDAPDQVPRRPRSQSDGYDQVPAETQKVEDPPARNRTVTSRSRSDSTTNEHDTQPNPNEEVPGKQGSSDHSPKNSVLSGPPDQAPRCPRSQSGGHGQASQSPSSKAPPGSTSLELAVPGNLRPVITQRFLDTGLSELQDRLLSTDAKPSAKIDALDCTSRLSERTDIKSIGAYSDVFQAKLDNRLVAVKALRGTDIEGIDETRMKKRLGREIYVWAALRHSNVLEFLGFAFEGGRPCLISPWCENGTLSGYLERHRSADRGSLVCQIAEGLNYLHLQNPPVVHGDLKTANVLITKDHIAKICDFGVSKHLGEGRTGFTTNGFVATTIRYSAPETLQEGTSRDVVK
ncbi:hypothetical protein FRC04_007157 [Tulasnella sp. 424]|nr:hypothetical protein FRC04_007157 [Tulasnella sp. 424]